MQDEADGFNIKQQEASLLAEENALVQNGNTPLVAVQRDEVGTHALQRVVGVAGQQLARALALKGLNFDGIGTEVGQDHGAVGARQHVCQVQNPQAIQGFVHACEAPVLVTALIDDAPYWQELCQGLIET